MPDCINQSAGKRITGRAGQSAMVASPRPRGSSPKRAAPRIALFPQTGGRDRDHRARPPELGELESGPAADRVAGDVRGVESEFVEQLREDTGIADRGVRDPLPRWIRLAMAGEIDQHHVPLGGEKVDDRSPVGARATGPMNQEERLAIAAAIEGNADCLPDWHRGYPNAFLADFR